MESFTSKEQYIDKLSGIPWHALYEFKLKTRFDRKTNSQEELY